MGSPQGHSQARDEAGVEAKNVGFPQRLRGEDHHSEDCTQKDHQQVHSARFAEVLLRFLVSLTYLVVCRFHAFLLFLGHPVYAAREVSVHRFSKILSEFALEYRTTRERVLQQKQKRANHRERNKTRGKMITDVSPPRHQQPLTYTP